MRPLRATGVTDLHLTGAVLNLPAGIMMLLITVVLVVGITRNRPLQRRHGGGEDRDRRPGDPVRACRISIRGNFHPFIPPNTGEKGHFGYSGIMAASATIFFAYIGFETVSVAAQETRNPERDVSICILASLAICTLLYVLMSVVLLGIIDWHLLDVPDPVSFALARDPALRWLVLPVNIAAIAGLISVAFGSMYGQSRVFYGMARDGFLPPAFAKVHPRFRTPASAAPSSSAWWARPSPRIFPLDILADLVSIGTLLAFIAVCVGIMILRVTAPKRQRQFRTPFVWFVAPAGVVTCGAMMFFLTNGTWVRLVVWTVHGLPDLFRLWHPARGAVKMDRL